MTGASCTGLLQQAVMNLAIFDLDNTLLAGDSDYLWGQFLVDQKLVDGETYARENLRFYNEYLAGTLDINEFAEFSMAPLARHPRTQMEALREAFVDRSIRPCIARGAEALLEKHRSAGDTLLITTATNRFITAPIAALLGVPHLLATEPEIVDGRYTGRIAPGGANFQAGKVLKLQDWIAAQPQTFDSSFGYSDSHNDLPLLRFVDFAHAVDPDPRLKAEAERNRWPVLSLR
jgi:HAD superfamily hydrolase (TIGR01490 family)